MSKTQSKATNNSTKTITAPVVASFSKDVAGIIGYVSACMVYDHQAGNPPQVNPAKHHLDRTPVVDHFTPDKVKEYLKSIGMKYGTFNTLATGSEYVRQPGIMDDRLEAFLGNVKARLTEATYNQALDLAQAKADRKIKGQGQLSAGLVREALADIFLSDVPTTSAGCPKGAKFQRIG